MIETITNYSKITLSGAGTSNTNGDYDYQGTFTYGGSVAKAYFVNSVTSYEIVWFDDEVGWVIAGDGYVQYENTDVVDDIENVVWNDSQSGSPPAPEMLITYSEFINTTPEGTSGTSEIKTDYPVIDKTPYNLIPQENNLTQGWGSI